MPLSGIDFHTHSLLVREMIARHPDIARVARETFYIGNTLQPLETFHLELDAAGLEQAVVLPIDTTTARNATIYTNEQIAELCSMSTRLVGLPVSILTVRMRRMHFGTPSLILGFAV